MRALIYEQAGAIGAGAVDVAGRPLLVRQLQWLRDQGIEDVVVEVALGSAANERAALLLGDDPLTSRCVVLPTRCAIGVVALSQRAGLPEDELFLALPADVLVHGPLPLSTEPVTYAMPLPEFAAQQSVQQLALRSRARELPASGATSSAWALRVGDLGAAHALSCAILEGLAQGALVHAAELKPGVWLARGASVSEDASLLPPVLIGPDARVLGQAQVGPSVVVGARAVIERDTVLSDAVVRADTLVGEGMRVRRAQVDPRGVTSFGDQARTEIDDPLQLTSTSERGTALLARAAALLLALLLLLPWTLGFSVRALSSRRIVRKVPFHGRDLHVGTIGIGLLDLLPALFDVLLGRRDLVGVAESRAIELEGGRSDGPRRVGAIDLGQALAPRASTSTLLWMWRWYLQNKSAKLDRGLFWQSLRRAWSRLAREKKRGP